jgi:4-diphosphocytidyl-2-C-methyl-D-erythritol kinase
MRRLHLAAPAKVNLGLRIVGRRPDGYHELESLFVPLDWGDDLALGVGPGDGIRLQVLGDEEGVPSGDSNLAWRGAQRFLDSAGQRHAVELVLTKRIPAGAGLGGGSSDAGAVLRGLDRLLPGALADTRLRAVAAELGADVPFFLDPRPAFVRGIGERIEPLAALPALALLLAHPGERLSTAEVYAATDAAGLALTPAGVSPRLPPLSALRSEAAPGLTRLPELLRLLAGGLLANDLEPAAVRLCPALATLRSGLEATGAAAVGLSGSGPTLYAVFPSREEAYAAARQLDLAPPARAWVAMTVASA